MYTSGHTKKAIIRDFFFPLLGREQGNCGTRASLFVIRRCNYPTNRCNDKDNRQSCSCNAETLMDSNLKDGKPLAKVDESLASCHFIRELR